MNETIGGGLVEFAFTAFLMVLMVAFSAFALSAGGYFTVLFLRFAGLMQ